MARKAATTAKPTARLARQPAGDEAQQSVEGIFVRSYPPTFRRAASRSPAKESESPCPP
ncbi:hypothetical protein [Pseudomonas aeruginosa]|uniref:hypothetical protein n=1 Tax=Pseudomonas aeruginosa TaxID=287 RepID=UPI003D0259F8